MKEDDKITYFCFAEINRNLKPTGKQRTIKAPTKQWASNHLAKILDGKRQSDNTITMPRGKKWIPLAKMEKKHVYKRRINN